MIKTQIMYSTSLIKLNLSTNPHKVINIVDKQYKIYALRVSRETV